MCSPQVNTTSNTSVANAIPLVGLPTDADIVCGRGRGIWTHPGNLKFKDVIERNLDAYSQAGRRKEKSTIINHVLDSMLLTGARFVKKEHNVWYAIDEKEAREKTAHAMRDFLKRRRKSQNPPEQKHKKRKRDQPTQHKIAEPDWTNSEQSNPAASMKRSYSDPSAILSRMNIFEFNMMSSGVGPNMPIHPFPMITRSKSFSDLNKSFDLEPTPILESTTANHAPHPPAVFRRIGGGDDERIQVFNMGSVDPFQNLFESPSTDERILDSKPSALDRPNENFNAPDFC